MASFNEHDEKTTNAVERVHSLLKELRAKYACERSELVSAVTEQVADATSEMESLRLAVVRNTINADMLRRQVHALAQAHDGPPDVLAAAQEANERLDALHSVAERCAAETAFLKSALLGDRIRREERRRQHEADDADLELRLRQIEDASAAARAELHSVNSAHISTLKTVQDALHECKLDAPTLSEAEDLRRLKESVLADLERVRTDNVALTTRVNALLEFAEKEEQRRNRAVDHIETEVQRMETSHPSRTKVVDLQGEKHTNAYVPQQLEHDAGLNRTPRHVVVSQHHLVGTKLFSEPQHISVTDVASVPDFRTRIAGFYSTFNPAKLSTLDLVLREYEGAEEELMSALEVHYGAFGYFSVH